MRRTAAAAAAAAAVVVVVVVVVVARLKVDVAGALPVHSATRDRHTPQHKTQPTVVQATKRAGARMQGTCWCCCKGEEDESMPERLATPVPPIVLSGEPRCGCSGDNDAR